MEDETSRKKIAKKDDFIVDLFVSLFVDFVICELCLVHQCYFGSFEFFLSVMRFAAALLVCVNGVRLKNSPCELPVQTSMPHVRRPSKRGILKRGMEV